MSTFRALRNDYSRNNRATMQEVRKIVIHDESKILLLQVQVLQKWRLQLIRTMHGFNKKGQQGP